MPEFKKALQEIYFPQCLFCMFYNAFFMRGKTFFCVLQSLFYV